MIDDAKGREAVEIKLTSAPTRESVARLDKVAEMIGANRRSLVCRIAEPIYAEGLRVCSLGDYLSGDGG